MNLLKNSLVLFFILFVGSLFCQNISKIQPKESQFFEDSVFFQWNKVESASRYKILISRDTLFQNITNSQVVTENNLSVTLINEGRYFWKIYAYHNSLLIDSSRHSTFNIFSPKHIDSLNLWVRADKNINIINGKIAVWGDLSDSISDLSMNVESSRPSMIYKRLNNLPFVKFDAINDRLNTNINLSKQNFSISAVYNTYSGSSGIRMINGATNWLFGPFSGYHVVFNGVLVPGKQVIPSRIVVQTAVSTNDTVSNFVNNQYYGKGKNSYKPGNLLIGKNAINGDIGEIIIVNGLLNDSNRIKLDNYLLDRYAPPIILGGNQMVCNLPYKLNAKRDYALNYLWSNGSTDTSIMVNSSGSYSVTITDIFGRLSSDTVIVQEDTVSYNVDFIGDTTICFGDSIVLYGGNELYSYQWNTGSIENRITVKKSGQYKVTVTNCNGQISIDSINVKVNHPRFSLGLDTIICFYDTVKLMPDTAFNVNYAWSNGKTDSVISVNKTGIYSLKVVDIFGCEYSDSIFVKSDSSLFNLDLGPDTSLCVGNSIGFINPIPGIDSYLWNTGQTDSIVSVVNSQLYSVNVIKGGCSLMDSVFITAKGNAPVTGFKYQNQCIGDSVQFIDTSFDVNSIGINKWKWSFTNGHTSTLKNPIHKFDSTLVFNVKLEVTNDSGCVGVSFQDVVIYPKPSIRFYHLNRCELDTTQFINNSTIERGSIVNYRWNFGNQFAISDTSLHTNPKYQYVSHGTYQVQLIAESNEHCIDTLKRNIYINEKPTVDFSFQGTVIGDSTSFFENATIQNGSIINYLWDFNNGQSSNQSNPILKYSSQGKYTVNLTVTSDSNCVAQTKKIVSIVSPPSVFNTIFPKNNQFLERIEELAWNSHDSIRNYLVQVSKNINFSNIEFTKQITNATTIKDIPLSNGKKYWRVIVSNGQAADTTDTSCFNIFSVSKIDSLNLWIRADSAVQLTNGKVSMWGDLSDSIADLTQTSPSKQPDLILNELNGFPVVSFDNSGDQFNTPVFLNNENFTISSVYNSKEQNRGIKMINGSNNWIYGPFSGLHRVFNGNFIGGTPVVVNRYVSHTAYSLNDTVYNYVNSIYKGKGKNAIRPGRITIGNNPINGNIAELIIINGNMSDSTRQQIDLYLMDKYAPPINLGKDRKVCTFPDSIEVNIDYALSFQWNTGETSSKLMLDSAGKYMLTVTDIFNRISVDSIIITEDSSNYKVELGFEDSIICKGSSIELSTGNSHLSYSWNTLENTPTVNVFSEGLYYVEVTNCIGVLSSDSVNIKLNNPEFKLGNDTTICHNGIYSIQPDSIFNNVTYNWSTGSTLSLIQPDTSAIYSLTVTDNLGCSYTDSILITIDSSLYGLTLGSDTSLCVGNQISLLNPNSSITSYAWSTNVTTPSTLIDSSGNYKVTISSANCSVSDSINVLIKGYAPNVNFSFNNVCFGDSIYLADSSVAPVGDTILSWRWSMGDNTILTAQNNFHLYNQSGNYTVTLQTTTDKGCTDTTTKVITVYPNPRANFDIVENILCSKSSVNFIGKTTISSGSLSNYLWDFGDTNSLMNTSNFKNPSHIYDTLGHYPIRLIAESNFGCIDSITKIKYINPTPNIQFDIDGSCLGDSTHFYDKTILPKGQINSYLWAFNWLPTPSGNQTSFDKNPSIYIPLANEVKVTLRVITDSNCQATKRDTFKIHYKPIANFNSLENCFNLPFQIQNSSSIIGDSIVSYQYVFDNKDTSYLENPIFSKNAIGTFDLELKIKSSNECYDSITKPIRVHELPIPNFKILNNNTGVPFKIEVLNTSSKATIYTWLFGNGAVSHDAIPNYVYLDTGVYNLQLKAESAYGCVDSLIKQINVLPYYLDAAISNVFLTEDNKGYLNIGVQYLNSGNNTINQIEFIADVNSNAKFSESFDDKVFSGNQSAIQFSNSYIQANSNKVNYVCIKISSVNNVLDDNYTNNEFCKEAFNENLYLSVFPNPTSSLLYFNYVLPNDGNLTLNIYDQLGRKVVNQIDKFQTSGVYKLVIEMSSLKPGIYHYDFIFNGTRRTGEIIKQ